MGEGSIVGPQFFTTTLCDIEILGNHGMRRAAENDLDLDVFLIGYADDVSSLVIGDSEEDVQAGIDIMDDEFEQYFSSAGLALNKDKSEVIMFRSHRQSTQIKVGDQVEADQVKLLGLTVQKNYKFDKHAKILAATLRTKVEKLGKVTPYLNFKYRKRVVEAIVLSSLMYCLPVWGWSQAVRRTAQKAMNKGLRLITQQPEMSPIAEQLALVGWPNMDNLWKLESIMALKRLINLKYSPMMYDFLVRRTKHKYMVRDDGLRVDWWPKNTHGFNAFLYTASQEYNNMRVAQSSWFNTVKNRDMTNKEICQSLLTQLIERYGNGNIIQN